MKDHYVWPGAHHLDRATAPPSCHGVFIDSFFLERISDEWDFRGSAMANDKKLIWRHCVTESELPLFPKRKGILTSGTEQLVRSHQNLYTVSLFVFCRKSYMHARRKWSLSSSLRSSFRNSGDLWMRQPVIQLQGNPDNQETYRYCRYCYRMPSTGEFCSKQEMDSWQTKNRLRLNSCHVKF